MRWGLVAVALLVAGCSQAAPVPAGIPVDDQGRALPTVQGYVVDEAVRPLAGVLVQILGEDVQTTTDGEGFYELHRPTKRAQSALVTAFLKGYTPVTHQVQVSGYVPTSTNFMLSVAPYTQPRTEVLEHVDSFSCRLVTGDPLPASNQDCEVTPPSDETPPPKNVWEVYPDPGLAGTVVEVHWNPVSDLSTELHVVLRGPVAGGFGGSLGDVLDEAQGPSPLRLEIPEAAARGFPDWTGFHVEASLPPEQTGMPVALAYNQVYTVFATLFYVEPAPPGYTLA